MATPFSPKCPDPHQPGPADDVKLLGLEKSLVVALLSAAATAVRDGAVDREVRAYVGQLHELRCLPEHMVIHVKRLLLRATRAMPDLAEARALSEALVLRAIRIYFEGTA